MEGNDLHDLNNTERYDELLARWLSGDLTEAELQELEASEGKEVLAKLREVTEAASHLEAPAFDRSSSWERLAASAGLSEESANEPVPEREEPVAEPVAEPASDPKVRPLWPRYALGTAVAAAIALLVVFVVLPGQDAPRSEYFADGKALQVELPDGSLVELNQGAKLSYETEGYASNREVELEGEAFFKVAKGDRFRVTTDAGHVDVLGTRFNVQTGDETLVVGCYSGKVRVADAFDKEVGTLEIGQSVALQKGKVIEGTTQGEVPQWAEKSLEFDNASMEEVVKVLELEFDVEIKCNDCTDLPISTPVSNTDLESALGLLATPHGKEWAKTGSRSYEIK